MEMLNRKPVQNKKSINPSSPADSEVTRTPCRIAVGFLVGTTTSIITAGSAWSRRRRFTTALPVESSRPERTLWIWRSQQPPNVSPLRSATCQIADRCLDQSTGQLAAKRKKASRNSLPWRPARSVFDAASIRLSLGWLRPRSASFHFTERGEPTTNNSIEQPSQASKIPGVRGLAPATTACAH